MGWALAVAGLVAVAMPRPAAACGGTFCDGGPAPMPVDQTGENVLFVLADGHVEAHVQIRYEGAAQEFAWIVPVQAVPEIGVGSDPLFVAMMNATVPTVTLQSRTEGRCAGRPSLGCGDARGVALEDGGPESPGGGMTDPDVVASGVAGAFEYAVLEGGTVDGVVQWLETNGYAQDDEAPPLLQEYLAADFLFVAFRLRGGAGIDEIHPVVLRYPGDEPCVPIRLTRIAAQEDVGVRVFFLGDRRFVPTNYRHVRINPLKLDWLALGANYEEVVTLAVDEEGAEGHAFVTEFAGDSSIVPVELVGSPSWSSARFVDLAASQVDDELERQGLFTCGDGRCVSQHPLLPGLMHEWLPTPAGLEDEEFWGDLDEDALDPATVEAFVAAEFAADLEERIVGPAAHAAELLEQPYLTRMYTTISPAEMTIDPLFHAVDGLPDVSNQLVATQVVDCQGDVLRIELDDGRELWLDDGDQPELAQMPWADVVETVPPAGAPMVVADHREAIDAALDEWNAGHDGCGCTVVRLRPEALLMVVLVGLGLRARRRR